MTDRFWEKVDKRGPVLSQELGSCWIWIGSVNEGGYGLFYRGPRADGLGRVNKRAHQVAWELQHGVLPAGHEVLHRCDNPPCVRPSHLTSGTHDDNMADMVAKGRSLDQRGSRNARAQITESDVVSMRVESQAGKGVQSIADERGITYNAAYLAIKGFTWQHVPMPDRFSPVVQDEEKNIAINRITWQLAEWRRRNEVADRTGQTDPSAPQGEHDES